MGTAERINHVQAKSKSQNALNLAEGHVASYFCLPFRHQRSPCDGRKSSHDDIIDESHRWFSCRRKSTDITVNLDSSNDEDIDEEDEDEGGGGEAGNSLSAEQLAQMKQTALEKVRGDQDQLRRNVRADRKANAYQSPKYQSRTRSRCKRNGKHPFQRQDYREVVRHFAQTNG